jgi:hypothetical protein
MQCAFRVRPACACSGVTDLELARSKSLALNPHSLARSLQRIARARGFFGERLGGFTIKSARARSLRVRLQSAAVVRLQLSDRLGGRSLRESVTPVNVCDGTDSRRGGR